ncbi:conserved hypothetical protein [Desulforapulum autotrophicum HRM2]|uniref:DUF362 domain-containing protein n=1 Tax=Desulforapulum autotrophicum (strain ATCC 43914 / DSM 3382 / VKM B-1955 / HRM2) TaxID=177437 RepID=C0QEP7_DESAH|nr:DUF362 domain-containing protein [Desulforapulum autotrophicum]ACN15389.1 conserved hypothetical protein [Desulforapulum autotrophicum HRM2]
MEKLETRRTFLKKSAALSTAAAGTMMFSGIDALWGAMNPQLPPDLVAVKNGEPAAMFDAAIGLAGGIRRFVKPNQTVVIKPNIGWNRPPESGANTNPELIQRIVAHCVDAGAKKVHVFDHSVENGRRCYVASGIESAAKSAGAVIVPGDHERYFQAIDIPNGTTLTSTRVHELVLASDVYINVPVLKHHSSSGLSLAMKNQMGVVWNRGTYHWKGLHQCIADFCHARKPDLNVMDGYRITLRNGPSRAGRDDVVIRKTLLLSTDIVAIDAAGARIFGLEPEKINHILYAHRAGIGTMDLSTLNIQKIDLKG